MERYLMISDAAKEVQVESHVLRYWEEELHLPIRRNELGHRYYTEGDVELFKQIKTMKEGGLQLKAIKMILKDGKLDVMLPEEDRTATGVDSSEKQASQGHRVRDTMAIQIIGGRETSPGQSSLKETELETREEKARRLQWLLQQLIRETLQENNKELCREIKESVVKELDYQFRTQEERQEERDKLREQREEAHYQKLDELLRKKMKKAKQLPQVRELETQNGKEEQVTEGEAIKKDKKTESGQAVSGEQLVEVMTIRQDTKRKKKPLSDLFRPGSKNKKLD